MASLEEVRNVGQSVWYDNISRELLLSGEQPIEGVEEALKSMMSKESLKVVIKKSLGSS